MTERRAKRSVAGTRPAARAAVSGRPARHRRIGTLVKASLAGVIVVGFLFVAVFPTQAYLEQRRAISGTQERVSVLREHNEELEEQKSQLQTDAGIEQIARERHGLVREGEKAYAVVFDDSDTPNRSGASGSNGAPRPTWPERTWKAMLDLL